MTLPQKTVPAISRENRHSDLLQEEVFCCSEIEVHRRADNVRHAQSTILNRLQITVSLGHDPILLSDGASGKPRGGSEPRIIYLGSLPELRRIFLEAKLRRKRGQKLVFTKPDGSPLQKQYSARYFKQACAKAGVGPYRYHDLRHTFVTMALKAGVNRTVIMKLTGHKTLAMFLRYTHLDKEQSESAMESLGEFLEKKRRQVNG